MATQKYHRKSNKFRKTRSKKQRGGISEDQAEKDTYLFDAINIDDADEVENALNNGANANATNWVGNTPLIEASDYKSREIVAILLDNKYGADVNAMNNNGDTALMKAINCNWLDPEFDRSWYQVEYDIANMVRMLLAAGADVNVKNKEGNTSLDIAIKSGCTEKLQLPLKQLIQRNKEKQTLNEIATEQLKAKPTVKKQGVIKQVLGQTVQNSKREIIGHPLADKIGSYLGGKRKTKRIGRKTRRTRSKRGSGNKVRFHECETDATCPLDKPECDENNICVQKFRFRGGKRYRKTKRRR
mgnify:FL=1